jgi:3-hydroxybutyrate dehydrogenase
MSKVALITGGASGIGLAVAKNLVSQGFNVVINDINDEGSKIAKNIGASFIKTDLALDDNCKKLIEQVVSTLGSIDILVNNAGIQYVSPIEDFPIEKWQFIISLMLTAPFLLIKYSFPYMKKNNWGRVININSVHGLRASEYKVAYVSAKHGLTGLTKVAALEGSKYNITVNSICPAYVRTPLVENQIDAQAKSHGIPKEKVIEEIMLKRVAIKKLVEPEDVGAFVTFLCSDAASCITGSLLPMDCGWSAM